MPDNIVYKLNAKISADAFTQLLRDSTLADRRPVNDIECMSGMINNSNLVVSAWDSELLVGIARSVTDFHYCCYLSDLAVAATHQKRGIGKALLERTQEALKPTCKLILLAAPKANYYYEPLGFIHNPRCWVKDNN